jgi:hypothetical protein
VLWYGRSNIFASLLAGLGNKTIAYSNLIQVIKSKTAAGFVPNFAAGAIVPAFNMLLRLVARALKDARP